MQPLHIACQRGFASCVKVLIEECNADPNCKAEVLFCLSLLVLGGIPVFLVSYSIKYHFEFVTAYQK